MFWLVKGGKAQGKKKPAPEYSSTPPQKARASKNNADPSQGISATDVGAEADAPPQGTGSSGDVAENGIFGDAMADDGTAAADAKPAAAAEL